MRKRKDALGLLFGARKPFISVVSLTSTGRIGVKPLQSNALLTAQKENGAAVIDETSLKHFKSSPKPRIRHSVSPSKGSTSSGGKGKEKSSARNSENEDEEDSGDEAEKLDDKQLNELDSIYRKYVTRGRLADHPAELSRETNAWTKQNPRILFSIPYDRIKNKLSRG